MNNALTVPAPPFQKRHRAKRLGALASALAVVLVAAYFIAHIAHSSRSGTALGDYPWYGSPGAATAQADVVITAMFLDSRKDVLLPMEDYSDDPILNPQAGLEPEDIVDDSSPAMSVVVSRVQVVSSLKGDLETDEIIEVQQMGSKFLGRNYPADGARFIEQVANQSQTEPEDGTVLLLLSRYGESPYSPINPVEGVLAIVGDQVISRDDTGGGERELLDTYRNAAH